MKTIVSNLIAFGASGNAGEFQTYGWSQPENGYTWTDGHDAGLLIPVQDAPNGFFIELFFWVNGGSGGDGRQRLLVWVNGQLIGEADTHRRMRLAWYVAPLPKATSQIVVGFGLPDAAMPSHGKDPRRLGLAVMSLRIMTAAESHRRGQMRISAIPSVRDTSAAISLAERVTGITTTSLAKAIESLGKNCEPGFFQRKCGAEPLSLLRFSGVIIYALVTSIDDGFSGIGDRAAIDPVPDEADLKDWIIYERRHMLRYHTWVKIPDASIEEMKLREAKRLPFLRDKLLEDMLNGEKIFVHLDNREISEEEMWPLFLAIRRRGPGTLLFIIPASDKHQAGMVEEVYPGLLRGYFSQFSSAAVGRELSMSDWLVVLTNAWLLHQTRHDR